MEMTIKEKALKWFWEELSYSDRDKYADQDLYESITEARFISEDEIIELYKQYGNDTRMDRPVQ